MNRNYSLYINNKFIKNTLRETYGKKTVEIPKQKIKIEHLRNEIKKVFYKSE